MPFPSGVRGTVGTSKGFCGGGVSFLAGMQDGAPTSDPAGSALPSAHPK